uniref:glycosyltransferase family 4 protein n=1 Tax=Alistipes sp. TaxID=1872444 RepID=UPI00405723DB
MKILLINNFHYRKGGSEAVYFNTADMLRRNGHSVIFFSCIDEKNEKCEQNEYFVPQNSSCGFLKGAIRYIYNREAKSKLEKLIRTEKPDVAHLHLFWGGLSQSILDTLKRHHIPIVHTAHDYRMVCPAYIFRLPNGSICEACQGHKFYRCLLNRCSANSLVRSALMSLEAYMRNILFKSLNKIEGVIYVSKFSQAKHDEYMPVDLRPKQSVVIYNNSHSFADEEAEISYGSYFLYYGRISEEKGITTLIRAFKERPQAKLKIVGTGPQENKIRELISKLNIHNVELLGYRTGNDLKQIVRNSQFVVVPSVIYENNPMTIVESYSIGIPVIGSDIGGIPEIVRNGKTGFLFSPNNVSELINCLDKAMQLSNNEYKEMCLAAKSFANDYFDENKNSVKLLAFYKSVIDNYEK